MGGIARVGFSHRGSTSPGPSLSSRAELEQTKIHEMGPRAAITKIKHHVQPKEGRKE